MRKKRREKKKKKQRERVKKRRARERIKKKNRKKLVWHYLLVLSAKAGCCAFLSVMEVITRDGSTVQTTLGMVSIVSHGACHHRLERSPSKNLL